MEKLKLSPVKLVISVLLALALSNLNVQVFLSLFVIPMLLLMLFGLFVNIAPLVGVGIFVARPDSRSGFLPRFAENWIYSLIIWAGGAYGIARYASSGAFGGKVKDFDFLGTLFFPYVHFDELLGFVTGWIGMPGL